MCHLNPSWGRARGPPVRSRCCAAVPAVRLQDFICPGCAPAVFKSLPYRFCSPLKTLCFHTMLCFHKNAVFSHNLALVTILSGRSRGSNYLYVVVQPPRPPLHPTQTLPGAAGCARRYLAGADPQALTVARRACVLRGFGPAHPCQPHRAYGTPAFLWWPPRGRLAWPSPVSILFGKEQSPGLSARREELGCALRPPPEMPRVTWLPPSRFLFLL